MQWIPPLFQLQQLSCALNRSLFSRRRELRPGSSTSRESGRGVTLGKQEVYTCSCPLFSATHLRQEINETALRSLIASLEPNKARGAVKASAPLLENKLEPNRSLDHDPTPVCP